MTRILGWIVLLAALAVGVLWLVEHPGTVDVVWMGYAIHVQIAILIAALFFGCLLLLPLLLLVRYLLGLPTSLRSYSRQQRQEKGMSALTHALTSLAVSDVEAAARQTRRATELLGNTPLTSLLGAQIAYRQDDLANTQTHLLEMLEHKETKFIAARALSNLSRQEGNYSAAIAFAQDALKESPKDLWGYRSLCDLYMREERWQEAELLVKNARLRRRLSAEHTHRLLAVFYYVQATRSAEQGQLEAAFHGAHEAHKQDAAFIPATLCYVNLAAKKGEKRKALAALERSFKLMPHPDLSEALIDLCHEDAPNKLTKRAGDMAKSSPTHPESYYVQAMVAIHLGEWDVARGHIKSVLHLAETARAYKLLAAIETGQNNNRMAATEWLALAAEAAPDPLWLCTSCGHQHKQWQLHCQHCDSFDALLWDTPKEHHDSRAASFLLEQG